VQDEYGLQVATGVPDRPDLRAGYVRAEGVNGIAFGPKLLSQRTAATRWSR
jgi:hypothetical protein